MIPKKLIIPSDSNELELVRTIKGKEIEGGNVRYEAKEFVKGLKRRVDANITALKVLVPREVFEVLEKEMLDPEITLQMQNISDMCAELPKGIRNQVENYIEGLHKVYKQK